MGSDKCINLGLLILRIGLGLMFIFHGLPKILAGPATWEGLGQALGLFGITFAPKFWGFMAAFAECFGGLCLLLGVLFQPACILLVVTMAVAAAMHLGKGDGLAGASHAIEAGIVFLGLLFTGPGKFTIWKKS
ncbi:DoxX family membrane protein [Candidatus Omnitrophota bacterium]